MPLGMQFLTDPEFWGRLFGIVLIDLVLAGDNALVIAMAVRTLPVRARAIGRFCGGIGAIMLRIAFTLGAVSVLGFPFLQLAGGVLLLWIATKLVGPGSTRTRRSREGRTFLEAVWIIALADVVMSLDNVLAVAAAAKGEPRLIVFGVSLSLPFVVWGSGVLARLMDRRPWVVWLGGGVLGYVAAEMVLRDRFVQSWLDPAVAAQLRYPVPVVLALLVVALGWRVSQRPLRREKES